MTARAIEDFVTDLARELPGPRRRRNDLLAELRGGLWDAADAYREAGLPAEDAERRAVLDCGTVAELAQEYRTELSAQCGRHAAALLTVTMLAGIVAWDLVWDDTGPSSVPAVVETWSGVVDLAGFLGGLAAAACMVVLVWVSRRWSGYRQADRAVRSVNWFLVSSGLIANLVVLTGSVAMNVAMHERALTMFVHSLPVAVLGVGSQVVVYVQARALYQTVRATVGPGRVRSGTG